MTEEETQKSQDAAESEKVQAAAKALGEHFDAVVILCSRHEGSRGTRTIGKGAGNWHTQYGLVREWLVNRDEDICENTRRNAGDRSE